MTLDDLKRPKWTLAEKYQTVSDGVKATNTL